ncbi:hypothetical protein TTHERM_01400710 (macronuclear) [Tetrahymena thermophila SB210]|uniref:Transmembrane protein n=1 Tax=Tetrahymena thermophila (strain SB210) TaxID=312017 RepID=Q229H8_TETTS|nr:hypothetical protein TTHERM_01400710 [Tetrahymena thermophila SB210]EAR81947.1 hypothetical protein TTHERM_01400710 [Tetrahymena thermophila SB210]|eukprot:XP_001029610.1 hypothetical protein TTHERM_01400710 [Tetrahymena thermophila SB210]
MNINFLLLITLCLLGLCISQQNNYGQKSGNDKNFEQVYNQTQEQANQDAQELIELFKRERDNGGQCFMKAVNPLEYSQEEIDIVHYEFSCYKHLCGITSKIPSSQEYHLCINKECNRVYHDTYFFMYDLKSDIKKCLEFKEEVKKINGDNKQNNIYDDDNSSQQNESQKEKENKNSSSSKKEDNNQNNIENVDNIDRDNKSFSSILSLLLLGFNILLF